MTSSAPTFSAISTRSKLLAVIGLAAALLYLAAGRMDDAYWLRMISKPIPVLMLALWVSGLRIRGRYQLAIMVGLLLSALGDILLEYSDATFLPCRTRASSTPSTVLRPMPTASLLPFSS